MLALRHLDLPSATATAAARAIRERRIVLRYQLSIYVACNERMRERHEGPMGGEEVRRAQMRAS